MTFVLLWLLAACSIVTFSIFAARLIFRLREVYPSIYERVGRPRVLSRSTEFLWPLRRIKDELAPRDRALLRACIVLLVLCWLSIIAGIGYAVLQN